MIKIRSFALLFAVVFTALALNFGTAAAQDNLDCEDFQFQEDAQAVYDADPSDPNGLDGPVGPDNDTTGTPGFACEGLASRGVDDDSTPVASPQPVDDGDDNGDDGNGDDGNGDDGNGNDDDTTVVVLPSTGTGDSDGSMISYAVIIAGAALVAVAAMGSLRHRTKN